VAERYHGTAQIVGGPQNWVLTCVVEFGSFLWVAVSARDCAVFLGGRQAMFVSKKRLLVEWGHCDPAGIVFYPQYLAWFDDCTTALFTNAGMPTRALFRAHEILGVPLVDVRVRFLLPSTFGDELLAESTLTEFRRSSFIIRHQFFKAGVLAVEGFETRVWAGADPANPERMKSRPLPAEVIERLSQADAAEGRAKF
jgi:4-hydroxybenzoyl-CoA thioesterase